MSNGHNTSSYINRKLDTRNKAIASHQLTNVECQSEEARPGGRPLPAPWTISLRPWRKLATATGGRNEDPSSPSPPLPRIIMSPTPLLLLLLLQQLVRIYITHIYISPSLLYNFLLMFMCIYIYIYCMSVCVLALLLAHRSEIRQNVAKFIIKRPLLAAGMYSSANFFFFFFFFFTNGDRSLLFLTCTEFQLISCFPCTTNLAS